MKDSVVAIDVWVPTAHNYPYDSPRFTVLPRYRFESRERKKMYTLAVANQKGGVTKTTTAIHLGGALARMGRRVLLVDLDPQGSETEYFLDLSALSETNYDLIVQGKRVVPVKLGEYIDLLPTNIDLAAAEIQLLTMPNFERRLKIALRKYEQEYDLCVLDCPPNLGVITRNALTAATESILVPVSTDLVAARTLPLMMNQVEEVRESELNPNLHIWRILCTLHNAREREDTEVLASIRSTYGDIVYDQPVPRRASYKKAARQHIDVADLDSELGIIWNNLAEELLRRVETYRMSTKD
jgi:chromosome partitioning protein